MQNRTRYISKSHMIESKHIQVTGGGYANFPAGASLPERTIKNFELVWIESGHVTWLCNGEEIDCPAPTIICSQPQWRDGYTWDPNFPTRHGFLDFTCTPSELGLPDPSHWPTHVYNDGDDILRPLLRHALWLHTAGLRHDLIESALLHCLRCFIGGVGSIGTVSYKRLPSTFHRALRVIHNAWGDDIACNLPLDTWAERTQCSRGHLIALFKKHVELSPHESLLLLRLERARHLLERSDVSIHNIAEQCGFATSFHFSRCFREACGMPPSQYRKNTDLYKSLLPVKLQHILQFI